MLTQQTSFSETEALEDHRRTFADSSHGDSSLSDLECFIETLHKDLAVLEHRVFREDSLTVASVAYRVKSCAKELGIEVIHQSAKQIETCARKNQMAQLSAEINLMRYQVELFVQSPAYLNRNEVG